MSKKSVASLGIDRASVKEMRITDYIKYIKNGRFEYCESCYFETNSIASKGFFLNGKCYGYWEMYDSNGRLYSKQYYL